MKIMNKLQNRKEELKKNNKGFSLVELIIVIAIMAILVGVVGTQVIPYLSKSNTSKDQQIVNSFSTAAVTAFSENAEEMPTSGKLTVNVYTGTYTKSTPKAPSASNAEAIIQEQVKILSGYNAIADLTKQFTSEAKDATNGASDIVLVFDIDNHTLTTSVKYKDSTKIKYPIADVTATL